jgi:hypothetical protein
MNRAFLMVFILATLLVGCQRGGTPASTPVPFGEPEVFPSPTLDEIAVEGAGESGGLLFEEGGSSSTPDVAAGITPLPTNPALTGQFTNLRFASSPTGAEQANFPVGTQEIYALWDYDGMQATDVMERLWFHNDAEYVTRREDWDFLKYGFSGTVQDIFLFDRIDGIDPGQWRVELYLNGEQQAVAEFTVGGP